MRDPESEKIDLSRIRARLDQARGEQYWRSLEELAETPEFIDYVRHEFPEQADTWLDPVSRRNFLKLMGASIAMAGLAACSPRQPVEHIVPYIEQPEEMVPGVPLFFATASPFQGYGLGVLARSDMGRPNKIEGNDQHPASLGATDAFAQASVLTLYDPDRSQVVRYAEGVSTWDAFTLMIAAALEDQGLRKGAGLRLLTQTVTSPTLARQIGALLEKYPAAKWHRWEAANRSSVRAGATAAFGEAVEVHYRFEEADVVLSLGSDFLLEEPGSVRYARDFSARRRVRAGGLQSMSRLYVVECAPSITGAMADHRMPLRAGQIGALARAVAAELGVPGVSAPPSGSSEQERWIAALARDLSSHRGRSLVVAGSEQPPEVHVLSHAINGTLGNLGRTVLATDPVEASPCDELESLRDLAADMDAGRVELLVILEANPVYDAPADLEFSRKLAKVPLRVRMGLYEDETSQFCHWHVPAAHYLETWSDIRAYDGTVSIMQPLIAPLYDGKSAHEFLAALSGEPGKSSHDIVKDAWRMRRPQEADFEMFWKTALNAGVVAETALPARTVALVSNLPVSEGAAGESRHSGLEIVFRPDPTIWDGRFANNGWLQELPKPLTKLTWDNVAQISPRTAERLGGLNNGDVVALSYRGRSVEAPVWIMAGHADDAVTVFLGYGRTRAGRVGTGAGFNASVIRCSDSPSFDGGLEIRGTGRRQALASTQTHQNMEGRELVRVATLAEFLKRPNFAKQMGEAPPADLTLYPGYAYNGYAWGMSIDTTACIGCNACVVACQAENNSPVVGKEEVLRGREMHWIRIDRYFAGNLENPRMYAEPVPCMHCENAPCELVCPVGATVHSVEGLNEMIYNRCVGTRYCSNNCPYKVRRFNFFLYTDQTTPSLKLLWNPNVTVRTRGVMEKCSYCVQRISAARITAEKEMREIRDGEVVTACQAACPTRAIVFGNINDPKSRVSLEKAQPLDYGLLTELNTRPRTTYLARLRNPNGELEPEKA